MYFDIPTAFMLLLVFLYMLVGCISLMQLGRLAYYLHSPRSFQFWFLTLSFTWCIARVALFSCSYFLPEFFLEMLYHFPQNLQFMTFSLLVLYYAFLLYQSQWLLIRKKYLTIYAVTNSLFCIITIGLLSFRLYHNQHPDASSRRIVSLLYRISNIYIAFQFSVLLCLYSKFGFELHFRQTGAQSCLTFFPSCYDIWDCFVGCFCSSCAGPDSYCPCLRSSLSSSSLLQSNLAALSNTNQSLLASQRFSINSTLSTPSTSHHTTATSTPPNLFSKNQPSSLVAAPSVPNNSSSTLPQSASSNTATSSSAAAGGLSSGAAAALSAENESLLNKIQDVLNFSLSSESETHFWASLFISLVFFTHWLYNVLNAIWPDYFSIIIEAKSDDRIFDVSFEVLTLLSVWEIFPTLLVLYITRLIPPTDFTILVWFHSHGWLHCFGDTRHSYIILQSEYLNNLQDMGYTDLEGLNHAQPLSSPNSQFYPHEGSFTFIDDGVVGHVIDSSSSTTSPQPNTSVATAAAATAATTTAALSTSGMPMTQSTLMKSGVQDRQQAFSTGHGGGGGGDHGPLHTSASSVAFMQQQNISLQRTIQNSLRQQLTQYTDHGTSIGGISDYASSASLYHQPSIPNKIAEATTDQYQIHPQQQSQQQQQQSQQAQQAAAQLQQQLLQQSQYAETAGQMYYNAANAEYDDYANDSSHFFDS